jgi:hypothetical protein
MVSIGIVADCEAQIFQPAGWFMTKLKRLPAEASAQAGASTLEFTTVSAIISVIRSLAMHQILFPYFRTTHS